jgi:hypothetical protein
MFRLASLLITASALVIFAPLAAAQQTATTSTPIVIVTAGKPTEYQFRVSTKTVKRGKVIFKITNVGKKPHSFGIGGHTSSVLRPHKSATLTVVFKKPARYIYTDAHCLDNPNGAEDAIAPPCASGILKVT